MAAVHRLYDAFNRQNTEATRELMDPEIEWVNPEDAVEPGIRHGFDEYQQAGARAGGLQGSEDRGRAARRLQRSAVRMHVHLSASGVDTVVRQSPQWTFRNGSAVRCEWSTEPERGFTALGELGNTSSETPER